MKNTCTCTTVVFVALGGLEGSDLLYWGGDRCCHIFLILLHLLQSKHSSNCLKFWHILDPELKLYWWASVSAVVIFLWLYFSLQQIAFNFSKENIWLWKGKTLIFTQFLMNDRLFLHAKEIWHWKWPLIYFLKFLPLGASKSQTGLHKKLEVCLKVHYVAFLAQNSQKWIEIVSRIWRLK